MAFNLSYASCNEIEKHGFLDIKSINPNIQVEARYATDWNFIGRPIDGYKANRCYLTKKAAVALGEVQKEVEKQGYTLLVFDCYRPQRSVTQFLIWTKDVKDEKMKSIFYPDEPKSELVNRGYIDAKSGHSRGSTLDLTLIHIEALKNLKKPLSFKENVSDCRKSEGVKIVGQLDMGTMYDCFSTLANTANPKITSEAKKNRELLKTAMEKQGFSNYPKEWWHFTLKNEPYKNDYFDFVVE